MEIQTLYRGQATHFYMLEQGFPHPPQRNWIIFMIYTNIKDKEQKN